MLSRRNVRIKVMQLLYMQSQDSKLALTDLSKHYHKIVGNSYELFFFSLLQYLRIVQYAKQDAASRKAKLRPTEKDKMFSPKLAENPLLVSLASNQQFNDKVHTLKLPEKLQRDNSRSIYVEFSKTKEYQTYLSTEGNDDEIHRDILLDLFRFCTKSELYNDLIEDHYPLWVDDKSIVIGTIKKIIRALPSDETLLDDYAPNDETIGFGDELLRTVHYDDQTLLNLIEPVLKNWDAERVAVVDMILLKMALSELLDFPTIPTKVTLNEYVEISKLYSTDKSKDFINGILDRLMKQLIKDGRIQKEGRGLNT